MAEESSEPSTEAIAEASAAEIDDGDSVEQKRISALIYGSPRIPESWRQKGNEMRVFVASLIVLSVLYFWDKDYNNGRFLDGLESMGRALAVISYLAVPPSVIEQATARCWVGLKAKGK
jgi:hypothetical protein